jgi:hypothetical protein
MTAAARASVNRPRPARPLEAEPDDLDVRRALREMLRYCHGYAGLPGTPTTGSGPLTQREKIFLWGLSLQKRPLGQRQIANLLKIYRSCQCWEFCEFGPV